MDFSCGANAFVPLVKQEGRKQGLSLKGKAYDITSQNMEDFERTSWLDTRPGQQPNSLSAPGIARSCFGKQVLCCVLTSCAWTTHDVRQPLATCVSCRSCQGEAVFGTSQTRPQDQKHSCCMHACRLATCHTRLKAEISLYRIMAFCWQETT